MKKSQIEKVKVGEVFIVSPHHSLSNPIPIYGIVIAIKWYIKTNAYVHMHYCDADGNRIGSGATVKTLSKLVKLNNL
jgi:hypothetical protein